MKLRFILLNFFFALLVHLNLNAQQLSPEASISILTCNPGTETYSMYGHSAIRVNDPANRIDFVFNYGLFSFDSPHFFYRFAKGQTDYMMGGQRFSSWLPEYQEEKRSVYEQILNLSPEGKSKLFQALIENAKPENRVYRYNFFVDNCATRVRDMIERNAGTPISFTDNHPTESYRDLIKQYHHSFRWIDFGIDLLVGEKADQSVSAYGQMFLPEYLMNQFSNAKVSIDGKPTSLVTETKTLLEYPNAKQNSDLPWPAIVFGLLFVVIATISVRAYIQKKKVDWLDYSLLALTGLAGLIIGWFTLFSEHPAMSPNYNLLWAFPLNIFFAVGWTKKEWRAKSKNYFWLMGGLLVLSLVFGQVFNPAVYFIILILMVRVIVNLMPERK